MREPIPSPASRAGRNRHSRGEPAPYSIRGGNPSRVPCIPRSSVTVIPAPNRHSREEPAPYSIRGGNPSPPLPSHRHTPSRYKKEKRPPPGRARLAARSDTACRAPTRAKTKTPASRPYAYIHMQEIHNPPQLSATPKYTTPTIAPPAPHRHSREGGNPSPARPPRGRIVIPAESLPRTRYGAGTHPLPAPRAPQPSFP